MQKLFGVKKLFGEPRFYADLALCAIVVLVIVAASGKSLPQLTQEAWAAVTSITGSGTQSALAQFTGTNTIGDAALSYYSGVANGTFSQFQGIGTHFACFLTGVSAKDGSDSGELEEFQCLVVGNPGSSWSLTTMSNGGAGEFTTCNVTCIN